jgi:hypothetical protein
LKRHGTAKPERFAGEAYGSLIDAQLREERALKASIELRAAAVITSSGVLVTLLFGFRALVDQRGADFGDFARWLIAGSLAAFVGAAVAAILANRPRSYEEADVNALDRLTSEEFWLAALTLGTRRSAELNVSVLRRARTANASKARALAWAFGFQLLAIGLLSLALLTEFTQFA